MSVGRKRGNKVRKNTAEISCVVSSLQVSSMNFYVLLFFLTYFLIKFYGIKLLLCKGTHFRFQQPIQMISRLKHCFEKSQFPLSEIFDKYDCTEAMKLSTCRLSTKGLHQHDNGIIAMTKYLYIYYAWLTA